MHERLYDVNIASQELLPTPREVKQQLPIDPVREEFVLRSRDTLQGILEGRDRRRMVVVGPCSIHDPGAALEYAGRLRELAGEVRETMVLVMRVYFSKPRTTVGWKGFVNDPFMDDSFRIDEGLKRARQLLSDLADLQLPTGTEALDPIVPQYLDDLITWNAIGARTTESQTHRELASGLSTPVGFKNATDGNIQVAINAMQSAALPHHFLGMNQDGQVAVMRTRGNRYSHIVLRGGDRPNYDSVSVAICEKKLRENQLPANLMIDCSHANSFKDPDLQPLVLDNCINQILEGNRSIVGVMLESHLHGGKQSISSDPAQLTYGVSVTDACIDWETTESMFSIVTPYFNAPALFAETVTCVQRQSLQRFEWILVDDGSSDEDSVRRLRDLEGTDPRVRVIRQENQGPAAARNRGFQEASCDFVMILDADDLMEPSFAEKALMALDAHPEAAFCNSWSVGFGSLEYLWSRGFEKGRRFLVENNVFPLAMIRRSVHLEVGGFDAGIRFGHEDWDYWLNFSAQGHWGITIPEHLAWYRRNPDSRIMETAGDPERSREFEEFLRHKHAAQYQDEDFPRRRLGEDHECAPIAERLRLDHRLSPRPRAVLMVLPWLCMGGADKFNLDLLGLLTRQGVPTTIATTLEGKDDWLPRFAQHTPDIFLLHRYLPRSHFPAALSYLIESRAITHVVISSSWMAYDLLLWLRSRHPEVCFLDYLHIEEEQWRHGGYPQQSVGWQDLLDLTAVSSKHLRGWMAGRGADADRIWVCTTNIDPEEWNPAHHDEAQAREQFDLVGVDMPILLFAGRLVEQKQPQLLLEILHRVAEQGVEFLALIVGDGPMAPALKHRTRELDLQDRVRFLGKRPLEDVRRLLVVSDLFLLPSKMEGISLALFEAMAMATPVLSSRVGGQEELVSQGTGWLVSPGEGVEDRFAGVLTDALADRDELRSMGQAARRRICEHFPLTAMGENMQKLMDRASADRRAPPAVSERLSRQTASGAVETARLQQVCEQQWHLLQRQRSEGPKPAVDRWAFEQRGQALNFLEICRRSSSLLLLLNGKPLRRAAGQVAQELGTGVGELSAGMKATLSLARDLRKARGLRGAHRCREFRRRARKALELLHQAAP